MSVHRQQVFTLGAGQDNYNPPVALADLKFNALRSVEPRLGRLFASTGYTIFQNLSLATGDRIIGFGYYWLRNRQFSDLYAFTRTSVYWFNFATGQFQTSAIYSGFTGVDDSAMVVLPWYDALYITKPRGSFVKLQHKVATVVTDAPWGRYGIIANSHVFLANVGDVVTNFFSRCQWSDLDAPESWVPDDLASEADFFDLEPTSAEITGLSYQRGQPVIYTGNDIWLAQPIGFPGGFKFDPSFPGLGNIFHDAVVRAKDVDFFIGPDNIYALNGLQPVPIGDDIYEFFINDILVTSNTSARGYLDTRKGQVFWVYTKAADSSLWSIVYNYKEKKWSERDPQDLSAWLDTPRISFRGYQVIDDIATVIDSDSDLIDDPNAGFPLILPQLVGTRSVPASTNLPVVGSVGTAKVKPIGQFSQLIETFDIFYDGITDTTEIHKATFEWTGSGSPAPTLKIAVRKTQNDTITYSAAINQTTNPDGTQSYYFRNVGIGKYLRFKIEFSNSNTDYITDMRLLSLVKIEDGDDEPAK